MAIIKFKTNKYFYSYGALQIFIAILLYINGNQCYLMN